VAVSSRTLTAVHAFVIFLALAAAFCVLQLASRPAAGFTPPPSSGDWIINDTTSWNSGAVLKGNLKIGSQGVLILDSANITFDCAQKCQYTVDVQGGGTLRASNTVFSARQSTFPYMFKIRTGANVLLDRCTVMDVGAFTSSMDSWGIYVHSSNTTITNCKIARCNVGMLVHGFVSPTIRGNNISGNTDRGIWCKFSSPLICDNRFTGNGYGIYLENDSFPAMLNNEFSDNLKDAIWMAPGCGAEWNISRPCSWVNSTMTYRGNMSVESGGVLWLQGSVLGMATVHGGLTVKAGGEVRLWGSTVQADGGGDAYYLAVESGGNLSCDSSLIKNAGWQGAEMAHAGLYIAGKARISGSSLIWNNVSLVVDHGAVLAVNSTLGGGSLDIWMNESSIRLVNVSFNRSRVAMTGASSVLEVAWHLSVGAVWQNGRGVEAASLTVKYGSGAAIYDGIPGGGWMRYLEITERRVTAAGATDTSNISLLAKKAGFDDIFRLVRVTSEVEERMVFTDMNAPKANISSPADDIATNRTSIQFWGTASDIIGLDMADISLDGFLRWTPLFPGQEAPFPGGGWTVNLTNLSQGNHRLSVRTVNVAGMTTYSNQSFLVDTEPPELELDEPFEDSVLSGRTSVRFRGNAGPVCRLFVGDVELPVAADGAFDAVVNFSEGRHPVQVISRDRAQNSASLLRTITVDITPPAIVVSSPPDGFRTHKADVQLTGRIEPGARFRVDGSTVMLSPDGSFDIPLTLTGGLKTVELYAEDAAGNGNITNITMTRLLDTSTNGDSFMGRFGPYIAAGAVAIIVVISAVALFFVRRRGRRPGPPAGGAVQPAPSPAPADGTVQDAVEVLEVDK